ncbi:hypothetical protein ACP70R_022980 [Stipagrostis hirtigluma subsp. patula]
MPLPSRPRLGSAPHGDCQHPDSSAENGVDWISSLPEELLLEILSCLHCLHPAVRTSVLSRRWHRVWTGLAELVFEGVDLESVEATLSQVTRTTLKDLYITFDSAVTPERVDSLLQAAAQLNPERATFILEVTIEEEHVIELPCFNRTTALTLDVVGGQLRLPRSGEFTKLKSLFVTSYCVDPAALVSMCPYLSVLGINDCWVPWPWPLNDTVTVHSASLEELYVHTTNAVIHRIDIDAPVLKYVELVVKTGDEFTVSLCAPMLTNLYWKCYSLNVAFGEVWYLSTIIERKLQDAFYIVSLCISFYHDLLDVNRSFAQEIAQLLVPNFSYLEMDLQTEVHVFGPMVLHILQIRPAIQRLKVVLARGKAGESCLENCPCDEPNNWRTENVALTDLEEVEIVGFKGKDHEVDLLKLLFRSAIVLKRVTVKLSDKFSLSNGGYKTIYSIFEEYPLVECYVYSSRGDQVSYP